MVNWSFKMGPKRPNRPSNPILEIIDDAVAEVLGQSAKVVVTSGRENQGEQYGSDRHGTGLAADVAIFNGDGTRLTATSPQTLSVMKAAARRGAKGFGWGSEYMGGVNFHIDMVEPKAGQNYTWGSEGVKYREEIIAIVTGSQQAEPDDGPLQDPLKSPFPDIENLNPIEKDFLSVYDVLERANQNTPVLIELDNLLLPKR
jgi:hypothetical protein